MEEEKLGAAVAVNINPPPPPSLGAVSHLLQHTLRSLCSFHSSNSSRWLYAVFWRILPRNFPPPKWDLQGDVYGRSRGNRRNWILAWEDGFCNFAANPAEEECEIDSNKDKKSSNIGLQPELFFKMSHDIYNYGEGLIGKVAADHGHRWVFREPQDQKTATNLISTRNPSDSQPRTWEAQFQCGVETIALVAVREGVVQLASNSKVAEDLGFVLHLRKQFECLQSIPGFLLPHPSAAACPPLVDGYVHHGFAQLLPPPPQSMDQEIHGSSGAPPTRMIDIAPSMSSLEALLSKLPPVVPPAGPCFEMPELAQPAHETEYGREEGGDCGAAGGGCSSMAYYVEVEKGFH